MQRARPGISLEEGLGHRGERLCWVWGLWELPKKPGCLTSLLVPGSWCIFAKDLHPTLLPSQLLFCLCCCQRRGEGGATPCPTPPPPHLQLIQGVSGKEAGGLHVCKAVQVYHQSHAGPKRREHIWKERRKLAILMLKKCWTCFGRIWCPPMSREQIKIHQPKSSPLHKETHTTHWMHKNT